MFRRKFFGFLGLSGAAAAATIPAIAQAETPKPEEKRDLKWARARCAEGHRVRLETWRDPNEHKSPGMGVISFHHGVDARHGLEYLDDVVVTVGMLEGTWEIVPEEDYPKPPEPIVYPFHGQGGAITLTGGNSAGFGGDIFLTTGDGVSTGSAGYIDDLRIKSWG